MKLAIFAGACAIICSDFILANDTAFVDAIKEGEFNLNFRSRYEDVNQTTMVEKGAQALTLRSRFTFKTQEYELFSALIEFDDVTAIPDDNNYNSGSNAQFDDAMVLDAEGTELNRIWVAYDIANTLIKYGRQTVVFDNERFFGQEAWRQNEQTFSGLSIRNESLNYTLIHLAQLNRVENILGESHSSGRSKLDAKIVNIEYSGILNSTVALYGYWLDSNFAMHQEDTVTYGMQFSGFIDNEPAIEYLAEYASQKDAYDNTLDYSADYTHLQFGITYKKVKLALGRETLGSDGSAYFVTPSGSLHNFQGWTDQFRNQGLGNIAGGLRDSYYSLGYVCTENFSVISTFHDFQSDDDSVGQGKLGTEWGIEAISEWDMYRFIVKYAEYDKENFGVDTEKLWLSAEVSF
jgi:hypothetical protein